MVSRMKVCEHSILEKLPHLASRNMVEFNKMEVFHNELPLSQVCMSVLFRVFSD